MSPMDAIRARLLIQPTIDTRFHIEYEWWKKEGRELDVFLRSHLCPEHQAMYADIETTVLVDTVDEATAEVTRVPGIHHVLISHCSRQRDYVTPQTSLVNAVFRIFLSNGNSPLTPRELGGRLARSPLMILRTFAGPHVHNGIRPILEG